ncbi:MAG: hypothetical protein JXC33_11800 [Deltaproteobacteria bacterium]|nr:hypothetical protein [Deltaproteobacteria bacterium]
MKKLAIIFVFLVGFLVAPQSNAAGPDNLVELYPDHGAATVRNRSYGFVAKFSADRKLTLNCTKSKACKNDEAKSAVLYGYFPQGWRIRLYDSSSGSTKDDWFEIVFLRDMRNVRYVIGTFEYSFKDYYIQASYHKKNGLDGKVSRIEVIPR